MEQQVVNNKKQFRFELLMDDGEYAYLEYRWLKGNMVLMRTFVPANQRGNGTGYKLVQFVLDHVRHQNLKAIIYCPFTEKFLKGHPEYNDIIVSR